jgi:pimeloyl-ACP methyl ester carboxylesterase
MDKFISNLPLSTAAVVGVLIVFALVVFAIKSWHRQRLLTPYALETKTTETGRWTWRYHTSGKGPDLIMLHGIGANLYCWEQLIPRLTSYYRVWAIDLPGFGGSSKHADEEYGLDQQAERLILFMDKMNIGKAHVLGNSMGGNIALWLARRFPHRVLDVGVIAPATNPKLVPLDLNKWSFLATPASYLMTRTAIRWAHRRTVSHQDRVDNARVEETFKTYGRQPTAVRSFIRATAAIRDPRLPDALKDLGTKVLLLWGTADLLVSKKVIEDLKAALRASESHIHDGGGHHLQEDDPDWVASRIVEFFRHKPD